MNEKPTLDPISQALEARLAAIPPPVSDRRREELLYECGRAAGRRGALPIIRRWQAAVVLLGVGMAGLGLIRPATQSSPTSTVQVPLRSSEPPKIQPLDEHGSSLIASVPAGQLAQPGPPEPADPAADPIENITTSFVYRLRVQ